MRKRFAMLLALVAITASSTVWADQARVKPEDGPRVQIAILLDTSNSMDGLINQAKEQLWKIVNEFTLAKQKGKRPIIEVALYEYGNDSLPAAEGHIRLVLPLTNDLDKVSEKLFELRTNGGSEYCGQVIGHAVKNLTWSKRKNDLKVILIAGNEPFSQGTVDYRKTCKEAATQGIIVNTIHCGDRAVGIEQEWEKGALLADGSYSNIDQNKAIDHIVAPQDDDIARLGVEMNATYLPFGSGGGTGAARQAAQDSNASTMSKASLVNRSIYKSRKNYSNSGWDLVDAVEENRLDLAKAKAEELPKEMQKMSVTERKEFVKAKKAEREKIRKKIAQLNKERQEYIDKARKEKAKKSGAETFDSAILKSMRKQAESNNFSFED